MNTEKSAIVEEIKKLDEAINKDKKFDVRFGVKLIEKVTELWKLNILKQIDEIHQN